MSYSDYWDADKPSRRKLISRERVSRETARFLARGGVIEKKAPLEPRYVVCTAQMSPNAINHTVMALSAEAQLLIDGREVVK